MPSSLNPYESPQSPSWPASDKGKTAVGASVLWFLGAAFAVNVASVVTQPRAPDQPLSLTIAVVFSASLLSAVLAVVSLIVYGLANLWPKRFCQATVASRLIAGTVFSVITWLGLYVSQAIEFGGPPGILSLPVAAVASIVVDRFLARLHRFGTRSAAIPSSASASAAEQASHQESTPPRRAENAGTQVDG